MGLATLAYYRRRIFTSPANVLTLGVGPLAAALFLAWVAWKFIAGAAAAENWSLAGILAAGVLLMLYARYGLKSRFFAVPRESDSGSTR